MSTRLTLHWLAIVRVIWMVFIIIRIGLFVFGTAEYFSELETLCFKTRLECHDRLLVTPDDLQQLQTDGLSLRDWAIWNIAYRVFIALTFCAVGILIAIRKHTEWNGLFFSFFLIAVGTLGGDQPALLARYPALIPISSVISLLAYISFALFFAVFPSGRVVPRLIWIPIGFWSLFFFVDIFFEWPPRSTPLAGNLAGIVWTFMFVSGTLAQIFRYQRVSNEQERLQTKWLIFGISVLVVYILIVQLSPLNQLIGSNVQTYSLLSLVVLTISNLSLTIFPLTIGIAILRYRLFDIDLIIRRTLQYSILTGLLGLVYFGGIVLFQSIFRTASGETSSLAIVLSTLIIAALFAPLRHRVQRVIDRRFFRKKYDAQQVLAQFAQVARDEVEMEKLTTALLDVVKETMQPENATLWLKKTPKN